MKNKTSSKFFPFVGYYGKEYRELKTRDSDSTDSERPITENDSDKARY